ncbi:tRNA (guanine(37)-N1)-methyltransferase 1-like isoform X2 [Arachis stenosperma]|uniref:tRNA (guanine(37)-N1)-methyltransferase 1-like isoform X2 n=1 Tax=Arachis stenosperma TaxID=217475 RepID=UPI0025AB84EE|nr:tRNA (guanine(37)-N1)-methyltransferase 1-like isoform X2 [Arachis stenosperma]
MKTAGSIFLRTHFPTPTKLLFLPLTNPKHSLSLIPISISFTCFSSTNPKPILYGPSLHKGTAPTLQRPQNDTLLTLHEDAFTRVFHLSALRVPSAHCSALERRLRGHLLNWPRVRNIARVPGDDLDPDLASLVTSGESGGGEGHVSLQRRIYGQAEGDGDVLSPVLYREKLARTFNTRGFVKFRNLAKISRPPKRKKKKKEEEEEEEKVKVERCTGKKGFATVEVVEEDDNGGGILGNLVEEEFGREKWRGSTRLLLLDERYAGRGVQDLPEAIKAVLKEYAEKSANLTFELVRCKLTLFYDYWQMNEILEVLLPDGVVVPSAFETVGHIAHLNLREEHLPYKTLIAKVVLDKNKPKIQTVVNKIDSIHNEYRTMQLEVLAGNHSLVTTVVENGIRFQVDLATVYWSSRLATERQRLLSGFTRKDVVCDVFSGVGPLAISAAKIVKHVFANDLNPFAVEYLERNSVLNKLERKIEVRSAGISRNFQSVSLGFEVLFVCYTMVFNMDGRRFIKAMYASDKAQSITQVVMNLPNEAAEFLDAFRGIYKDRPKDTECNLPTIHVYGFSKAQDPEFDFHERLRIALLEVAVDVEMRRVRLVAPGKWMLCASFVLPRSVAFANTAIDT